MILAAYEYNGMHTFSIVNYSAQNFLIWERLSESRDSAPVALMLDSNNNICVCGNTKFYNRYAASIWKFNSSGVLLWHADYDGGGNTYARQIQTLFNDDIALGVTVASGSDNYGQYERRSVTYSSAGSLLH
jgi:hypothetical protein